tara:strand:+ start:23 stop:361 length:339 start_codon:yes stop_codon:yes gene_type:complete
MKVNIKYTVDLEEVLKEMSILYYKSADKLHQKLDIYDHLLENDFHESNLDNIIHALTQNVNFYHDHQAKISEIINILVGYKNIKEGDILENETEQTDAEVEEKKNDSTSRGD